MPRLVRWCTVMHRVSWPIADPARERAALCVLPPRRAARQLVRLAARDHFICAWGMSVWEQYFCMSKKKKKLMLSCSLRPHWALGYPLETQQQGFKLLNDCNCHRMCSYMRYEGSWARWKGLCVCVYTSTHTRSVLTYWKCFLTLNHLFFSVKRTTLCSYRYFFFRETIYCIVHLIK